MKLVVKNIKDSDSGFRHEPLSYRVSLRLENNNIVLTREYFRVGFHDGEKWDGFYFDCDNNYGYGETNLNYATFMTRKLDDKLYLQQKELELIDKFYDKLIITKNKTIKKLKSEQKRYEDKINNYDITINFLDKYKRKDKILKIVSKK